MSDAVLVRRIVIVSPPEQVAAVVLGVQTILLAMLFFFLFYFTFIRWFFRLVNIEVHYKSVVELFFFLFTLPVVLYTVT